MLLQNNTKYLISYTYLKNTGVIAQNPLTKKTTKQRNKIKTKQRKI